MKRRVVVTGLGAISPLGLTIDELWVNLLAGRSGVGPITRFDATDFPTRIAAEIKGYDPLNYLEKKDVRHLDLSHQYGLAATADALKDAGLNNDNIVPNRTGAILGSAHGGAITHDEQYSLMLEKGVRFLSPSRMTMIHSDMAPSLIAIKYGLRASNYSVSAACASGTIAIGGAFHAIRNNEADVMITGGTDSDVHAFALAGFSRLKAISTRNDEPEKASRPFDKDRDGFIVAEGAGIIIIEELEHAVKRNAKIYAEVIGYGTSCDGYHWTAPEPTGEAAALSIEMAIRDAGIKPEDVDYINTHGTATGLGDPAETKAIKKALGEHAYKVTLNSSKSMLGHLMGGAGGIEALITCLSIRDSKIHPTMNLDNPDPECDLNYSANKITEKEINIAMSDSFGFGGHNAIVVLKKYEG